jgi:hypothetical protein
MFLYSIKYNATNITLVIASKWVFVHATVADLRFSRLLVRSAWRKSLNYTHIHILTCTHKLTHVQKQERTFKRTHISYIHTCKHCDFLLLPLPSHHHLCSFLCLNYYCTYYHFSRHQCPLHCPTQDGPVPMILRTSCGTYMALGISTGYFVTDFITCLKYNVCPF